MAVARVTNTESKLAEFNLKLNQRKDKLEELHIKLKIRKERLIEREERLRIFEKGKVGCVLRHLVPRLALVDWSKSNVGPPL